MTCTTNAYNVVWKHILHIHVSLYQHVHYIYIYLTSAHTLLHTHYTHAHCIHTNIRMYTYIHPYMYIHVYIARTYVYITYAYIQIAYTQITCSYTHNSMCKKTIYVKYKCFNLNICIYIKKAYTHICMSMRGRECSRSNKNHNKNSLSHKP